MSSKKDGFPPFTIKQVNRILVAVIVILSILAGYYHALYSNETRKYQRLLTKYEKIELQLEEATPSATLER